MIDFNFQSFFANKNNVMANAQMLPVFRFIEQESLYSSGTGTLDNYALIDWTYKKNKNRSGRGERVSRSAFGYNAARSKTEASETFTLFCRGRIRGEIRYGRKRKRGVRK